MKRTLITILLTIAIVFQGFAQDYTVSKDRKSGYVIYKGRVTPADLKKEPSFTWYQKGVGAYVSDKDAIAVLKNNNQACSVLVFMGTWCGDSHDLVPKLVRVMNDADFHNNFTMYGVDRDKNCGDGENKKYNIVKVPTIIVLKNGKEVGRITESVSMTMEDDLVAILKK